MSVVLDGSVTLSWCFLDEHTEASLAVASRVADEGAVVPALWWCEVANGLQMAVRRRRIDEAYRDLSLADLTRMEIQTDPQSEGFVLSASVRLAERHGLTVYDAAYLELAQRRRLELATLDTQLIAAARAELVPVIGT